MAVFKGILMLAMCLNFASADPPWPLDAAGFPDPQVDWSACSRTKASFICNPEDILQETEASQLDQKMEEIRRKTACLCEETQCVGLKGRYTLAIVVISRINGTKTPFLKVRQWSQFLRLRYSDSHGSCDENSLIGITTTEAAQHIAAGFGAHLKLTPQVIQEIVRKNREFFDRREYYKGLEGILDDIKNEIEANPQPSPPVCPPTSGYLAPHAQGIMLMLGIVLCISGTFIVWW